MEITPCPPPRLERAVDRAVITLAVAALLLGLVMTLPMVFGLQRTAMADSGMGSALPEGSLVITRGASPLALEVGDVVSYVAPDGAGSHVQRVVGVSDGLVVVQGDAQGSPEPWLLDSGTADVRRMVAHVPWLGYPFLLVPAWVAVLLFALMAAPLFLRWRLRERRQRDVEQERVRTSQDEEAQPLPMPRSGRSARSSRSGRSARPVGQ